MKIRSLLLLIVFLSSIIPVTSVTAENQTQRNFDDSVALLHASRSILLDEENLSGTSKAPGEMLTVNPSVQLDTRDTALANLIQATKDQRNTLDASCSQLKGSYNTSDRKCERQVLEDYCSTQREKLNTRLGFLHKLRGDQRKLFTRMWHGVKRSGENVWRAVGPVGRRLLRRVGPEVVEVVLSGGALSRGLLRKIVLKEARNIGKGELERLLNSGVERFLAGQAAFAQAAGVGDCTSEKLQEAREKVQAGLSGKDLDDQPDEADAEIAEDENCDPSESWMNAGYWENEVLPMLVNEGKGCSGTSAYQSCLEQKAAEGLCRVDAFAACETVYETIVPTKPGQKVHIIDNEVYHRDHDNHFDITFPLDGGPVSGYIAVQYLEDKGGGDYCQVAFTFTISGSYNPNTCLLSGTGVKTLALEENRVGICVGYPEPYDDLHLDWSMEIINGLLNTGTGSPISEAYGIQNYLK